MIRITIGQSVLFHPLKGVIHHTLPPDEARAATVAHVNPDGRLNLGVLDKNGVNHSMTDVPCIQPGETPPENGYYAEAVIDGAGPESSEDVPLSAASKPAES